MDIDAIKKLRSEACRQKLMLTVTVAGTSLLVLLFYLSTLFSGMTDPVVKEKSAEAEGPPSQADSAEKHAVEQEVEDYENEVNEQVAESVETELEKSDELAVKAAEAELGRISGVVLRKGHGTPVRRLRLMLADGEKKTIAETRSGADGGFTFANLDPGRYILRTASGNFDYAKKPILLGDSAITDVRFEVKPHRPAVKIARYSHLGSGSEMSELSVGIFRFGKVSYKLYKLNPAASFEFVTTLDDLLEAHPSEYELLHEREKTYKYSVAFTELKDTLGFDVSEHGLYLLEARGGNESFRGLISVGSLSLEASRSDSELRIRVVGAGGAGALVKVMYQGELVGQGACDSEGMLSIPIDKKGNYELLAASGSNFAYSTSSGGPTGN